MTAQRVKNDYGTALEDAGIEWLFVGGCQRSGTSAMVHLLNLDERVVMGLERFKYVRTPLSTLRFAPQIFFNPVPQETNGMALDMYDMLRDRWAKGGVRYLGDKNPVYVRQLTDLEETYPGCRLVMMLRNPIDVANSFYTRAHNPRDHWPERNDHRAGISVWNDALESIRDYVEAGRNPLFIVEYESLFAGKEDHLEALYRFLDLSVTDTMREHAAMMCEDWPKRAARPLSLPADAIAEVEAARNHELESWARERIASQLTT